VGEVLVDLVAPDAGTLEEAQRFLRTAGGAPANVAAAVARLGGRSSLAGAVGDDPFGVFLRQTLEGYGVDTTALRVTKERTTLAFVARNRGGIPDFVFYRGADAAYSTTDLPLDLLARSRFVYLSSMALMSEPSRGATLRAAEEARAHDVLIAVDPNLRPSSWPSLQSMRAAVRPLLQAADILKINLDESRVLVGEGDLEHALPHLGREDALTVVTLGGEGCRWYRRRATGSVPAPQVEVQDTTGAGDAFMGALLAELARLDVTAASFEALGIADLERSLRFACAAAAVSCTRTGAMASLPTRDDVDSCLR
jgi:fructokinase